MDMAEPQVVEQQVRAPVDRRAGPRWVSTGLVPTGLVRTVPAATEGVVRPQPAGTHVLPLGPGSRFARFHWGGQCVNCGETVFPGERGWIDPTDTEVLCVTCWPPLTIG